MILSLLGEDLNAGLLTGKKPFNVAFMAKRDKKTKDNAHDNQFKALIGKNYHNGQSNGGQQR